MLPKCELQFFTGIKICCYKQSIKSLYLSLASTPAVWFFLLFFLSFVLSFLLFKLFSFQFKLLLINQQATNNLMWPCRTPSLTQRRLRWSQSSCPWRRRWCASGSATAGRKRRESSALCPPHPLSHTISTLEWWVSPSPRAQSVLQVLTTLSHFNQQFNFVHVSAPHLPALQSSCNRGRWVWSSI